jgi:transcriptional regulator with XRE-family HTH domain
VKYYKDHDFIKKFGQRLRQERTLKKMSQEELANETGFEVSQISRIERGVQNTSISHVSAIAKALDIDPSELFRFE